VASTSSLFHDSGYRIIGRLHKWATARSSLAWVILAIITIGSTTYNVSKWE